jgi:ABC-type antimicrobial peptide transport system permease subunit
MSYAIRSSRVGTPDFLQDVREAIWSVNPNLPVMGVRTLPDLMAQSMARTSFTLILLGIAGGVALILGIIGVYGVISYGVSQRSRELGLRMALGAQAEHVKAMVLRQGLILSGVGAAIGLGLAFGLTRLMSSQLYGVNPVDPLTYSLVAAGLLTVALVASYIPAWRAARVDPMKALRQE